MFELAVRQFVRLHFGAAAGKGEFQLLRLPGGVRRRSIYRVVIRRNSRPVASFVVKPLAGNSLRELHIYRALEREVGPGFMPRCLGWHPAGERQGYLFLEWIRGYRRWPWAEEQHTALVFDQLSRLHASRTLGAAVSDWDYESELRQSAASTMEAYRACIAAGIRPSGRVMLKPMERLAGALMDVRRELLAFSGPAVVHGDAHPGNAVVRRARGSYQAILLDWERARPGSAIEDVSSWMHSLAFWEKQVKKRYDTLLSGYLYARGLPARLSPQFRDACRLAGVCNAFAGALRYHLIRLLDPARSPRERACSWKASSDWLRILRAAENCWGS